MRVGFVSYVLVMGVFLILFSILGLLGSIDTGAGNESLTILLVIGVAVLIATFFRKIGIVLG